MDDTPSKSLIATSVGAVGHVDVNNWISVFQKARLMKFKGKDEVLQDLIMKIKSNTLK